LGLHQACISGLFVVISISCDMFPCKDVPFEGRVDTAY